MPDLAERAGLAPNTVSRFENGAGTRVDTLVLIQHAPEEGGVFVVAADDARALGVR